MFQLDLGKLTLALIGAPRHKLLDKLVIENGPGTPLCRKIFDDAGIDYEKYMENAPEERLPSPQQTLTYMLPIASPPASVNLAPGNPTNKTDAACILDAVAKIPPRQKKGEGRAAELLAQRLGISPSTVYQAKRILHFGGEELIQRVRNGEIGIKKASKSLKQKEAG